MTDSPQYEYEELLKALSLIVHDALRKSGEIGMSKHRAMVAITKIVNDELEDYEDEE